MQWSRDGGRGECYDSACFGDDKKMSGNNCHYHELILGLQKQKQKTANTINKHNQTRRK